MDFSKGESMAHEELVVPSGHLELEYQVGGIKKVKESNKRIDAFYSYDPRNLVPMEGFNVRVRTPEYEAHVRELADNMKAVGFNTEHPIPCLVMRHGDQDVVAPVGGHSRLEAVMLAIAEGADIPTVSIVLKPKDTSVEDLIVALHRDNTGRPLTVLEQSVVAERLAGRDLTPEEIAEKMGCTMQHVRNMAVLASAPAELRQLIADNTIAASMVIDTIKELGAEGALAALTKAAAEAKDNGRGRVTAKLLPNAKFKKALKKSANKLYDQAERIVADPGFSALTHETQRELRELLAELDATKDSGDPKDENQQELFEAGAGAQGSGDSVH